MAFTGIGAAEAFLTANSSVPEVALACVISAYSLIAAVIRTVSYDIGRIEAVKDMVVVTVKMDQHVARESSNWIWYNISTKTSE